MENIKPDIQDINEKYLTEHADIIDWIHVSSKINVNDFSLEFFHRFDTEIDWRSFSLGTELSQLSEEFMIHFKDRISWFNVVNNISIRTDFAHKFQKEIGQKMWFNDSGRCHKEDGPAMSDSEGREWWYKNGKKHRLDGPAVFFPKGTCPYPEGIEEFWVDDLEYDKHTFYKKFYKQILS